MRLYKPYITLTAGVALALGSCSEQAFDGGYKPSLEGHYLGLTPRDFAFTDAAESKTGSVKSLNSWEFGDTPEWLAVSPAKGSGNAEVTFTSAANTSLASRQAVFFVDSKSEGFNLQRAVTAAQSGVTPYVTFKTSSSNVEATAVAQTLTYDIDSNLPDLQVSFPQDWGSATYDAANKKVRLSIQENRNDIYRTGDITISSPGYNKSARLTLTQHASNITMMETLAYEADGGSQTVSVQSDLAWTAKTESSWIEFTPGNGKAGTASMKVTALSSYQSTDRTGYVYFYFGDKQRKYITVTQGGRYLNLSESSLTLNAEDGSKGSVTIDSNIGWEVTSSPSWLTFSSKTGNAGKSTLTMTATKNNSLNERSGTVTISDNQGGAFKKNMTITQKALEFSGENSLEFGWQASSQQLRMDFPGSWTATTSSSWITLGSKSGTGAADITVSVTRNDSEDVRTGSIKFTSEGKTFDVDVVQSGQYLKIDNTSGEFGSDGGEMEFFIHTSIPHSYEIEYNDSNVIGWIMAQESEDDNICLHIAANPSIHERTASFWIVLDEKASEAYAKRIKFSIRQRGRSLTVECGNTLVLPSYGGLTSYYDIVADGEFEVVKNDNCEWYQLFLSKTNDAFQLNCVKNESEETRNGKMTISLKNLPDGESEIHEITIYQHPDSFSIKVEGYGPDENLDL